MPLPFYADHDDELSEDVFLHVDFSVVWSGKVINGG